MFESSSSSWEPGQPDPEGLPPVDLLYGDVVDPRPGAAPAAVDDTQDIRCHGGDDEAGSVELSPAQRAELAGWVQDVETAEEVERLRDEVDDLDAHLLLARAAASRTGLNRLGGQQLLLACHWADLHTHLHDDPDRPRLSGREQTTRYGGDGTPEVAEFCPAELGTVLGVCDRAARLLVGDALDLRHRHPRLWARVLAGEVDVWTARQVASRSRHLPKPAADRVDAKIAATVGKVAKSRLLKVLDAEILRADPDRAKTDTDAAADRQGVWLDTDTDHGHATLFVKAPAPDLRRLDHTLDKVAAALTVLGDTDPHDTRRATALTLLADPSAALDLLNRADQAVRASMDPATLHGPHDGTTPGRGPDHGRAVLYVHLTAASLTDPGAVARVEDVGPALLAQVRDWLAHRHVTLKPVIDLPALAPVDRYEVPDRHAEAVRLRNPASCFPHSPNTSRHGDNDHTTEYLPMNRGGPPGQTDLPNLGRLTRTEHRVKTHTAWQVRQLRSGCWLWRSPHGHHYLVDETGTTNLGTDLL